MDLTPDERQQLQDLLDLLIEETDEHPFWLNRVRETAIELRKLLTRWLDTDAPDATSQGCRAGRE